MGTIILIIAAIMEVALVTYSLITKSFQVRIRSWIRIGTFAAFVIFSSVSIIQWGFRWYLLTAVLLIWAIIGGVSLARMKVDKKEFKPVRIVVKAIAMWLIVVIAITPALILPQYKLPKVTGKYQVATTVFTYTDKNRIETFSKSGENREVTVEFWYPEDNTAKFPLVIFSHGAFGIKTSNTSTFKELASNGYVVCSIDHPYHSLYTKDTDGNITTVDMSFMQEVNNVNTNVYDEKTEFDITHKWLKLRTDDINFVLNTITENTKTKSPSGVYELIDTNKIGLFGHSLGGAASAQLGRERRDIDAVIDIDGSLIGEQVECINGKTIFNKEIYPLPILFIYTDAMMHAIATTESVYPGIQLPEKLIPATNPNAFEVYFKGTNHMSVTDLPLVSPFLVNIICGTFNNNGGRQEADKYYIIEKMNSSVLQFFNCYLKGEGSFHSS